MADAKSIPIKLLHESEKFKVTVELKNGEVYRGTLLSAEDNMNCHLSKVTMTQRDGQVKRVFVCALCFHRFTLIAMHPCDVLVSQV